MKSNPPSAAFRASKGSKCARGWKTCWKDQLEMNDVYLAPSQFEAGFISAAHPTDDVEKTVKTAANRGQRD